MQKLPAKNQRRWSFTVIDLMVVIAIAGVLMPSQETRTSDSVRAETAPLRALTLPKM